MWCEKQTNGTYHFKERYTDPITGEKRKVSIAMPKNTNAYQKRAQTILNEKIEIKLKALLTTTDNDYTVKDLVEGYRAEQKRSVKASTYRRNYFTSQSFMKILGEDISLTKLTAKYIKSKWLASDESNSTLNERLKRWKGILRWGYQNDYLDDIRFLDKLKPLPDVSYRSKIENKFLEKNEFLDLISEMQVEKWKLLTQFLGLSGIRIGEAIALDTKDIDFKARVIHVSKTFDSNNTLTTTPKSNSSFRDVYMQDDLYGCAKEIKSYMLRQALMYGYGRSQFFMQHKDGTQIHYYSYNKYLKDNALRILGREDVTPHILRHTHTCMLAENGVALETITRRLGHEDSDITKQVYLHVTEKMKQNDNAQIDLVKIM